MDGRLQQVIIVSCPHCCKSLTDEEVLSIYAGYCSRKLKGRTSEKKKASSVENGKKGGRPRKIKEA